MAGDTAAAATSALARAAAELSIKPNKARVDTLLSVAQAIRFLQA